MVHLFTGCFRKQRYVHMYAEDCLLGNQHTNPFLILQETSVSGVLFGFGVFG